MALFVSLLLWACLSWIEGSEGVRECASQRLPASPLLHGARSVCLDPALLPISSLTLSNDRLILWLSFLLCKMGLISVETLWDCCREPAGSICPQCSRLSPALKRTPEHQRTLQTRIWWSFEHSPEILNILKAPSREDCFFHQWK